MAGGWARDDAVQEQIDASVEDGVRRARERIARGESRRHCEECGGEIPEARRTAVPGVRRCVPCQEAADGLETQRSALNRRASKDSQLR